MKCDNEKLPLFWGAQLIFLLAIVAKILVNTRGSRFALGVFGLTWLVYAVL